MSTKPPSLQYALGTDSESTQANDRWQQAYDQLLRAVDARQEKPMFDPFWLKIAESAMAPTRTGSYFETLGNTAGAINKFQQDEQAQKEDIAQKRLEIAGMGVQQANQRAAMQMYQDGAAPATPPGSAPPSPSAPSAGAMEPSPSDFTLKSMGIDESGVQLFPPQPLVPEKQFVASELLKGGNVPDAKIKYQEYLRKDIDTTQNGLVIQRSTGRAFEMPDPTPASVPFLSMQGEPFSTTKFFARKLDALTNAGDNEGRIALENKIRGIGQRPPAPTGQPPLQVTPMPAATGIVNAPRVAQISTPRPVETVPQEAPPPSPMVGMRTPSQLAREKAEEEQKRAIAQATAIKQAETNIATEAENKKENRKDERETLVELKTKARAQVNIADQVAKIATDFPNSIGTTAKPGILAAGIKLLEGGANIGTESAKASALEEAYQTLTGTQDEISARRVIMGLAAEYLFNLRALTKGQGTITDYETKVLQSIGPSLGDDAKTARFKAHIMKMHSENEIDRVNVYQDWKKSPENKNLGWRDFLGSKENDKFGKDYNAELDKAYDAFLGRKNPIGPPAAQPTARPAPNKSMDFARGLK